MTAATFSLAEFGQDVGRDPLPVHSLRRRPLARHIVRNEALSRDRRCSAPPGFLALAPGRPPPSTARLSRWLPRAPARCPKRERADGVAALLDRPLAPILQDEGAGVGGGDPGAEALTALSR